MADLQPSESFPHPGEHRTNIRFSLANREIGSVDHLVHHPTGDQRVITYPRPEQEQLAIRGALYGRQLILGKLVTEEAQEEQTFVIPDSARPLVYDAASRAQGAFSYNDSQLFSELGQLLASATQVTGSEYILKGDIPHAVAIVEFTRPGQRKLLFSPGVERLFVKLQDGVDPLGYYAGELGGQFGDRFLDAAFYFRSGYEEGLATEA